MAKLYKIYNSVTGKYFLLLSRSKEPIHKILLIRTDINHVCCNKHIRKDVVEYGRDSFKIEVLKESDDMDALNKLYHENYIEGMVYNTKPLTLKTLEVSSKLPSTRKKMSLAKKGSVYSQEIKDRRENAQRERMKNLPPDFYKKTYYILYHGKVYAGYAYQFLQRFGINVQKQYKKYNTFMILDKSDIIHITPIKL